MRRKLILSPISFINPSLFLKERHPIPDDSPLVVELPDEEVFTVDIESQWELYFDGASRTETDPDSESK
jgi:hypothetical protein